MGVSSRTLEITVISCENLHVTEDSYVVVRAESLNCCTTKMAKDSGANKTSLFSWNEKLMVTIPMYAKSITFEVQCNKFKSLRPVAVARIALSDFLNDAVPENTFQLFSYRLRDWEGKRNGIIHFAVRMPPPEECFNFTVKPVKGTVPCKHSGQRFKGIHTSDKNSNDIVIGVPFWWNYPNII
ncbi:hypothetical protein VNO77_07011 [Canavalia gladiata]|uniref:C2 domain-containing protein n=1 Tax=Canavalia gladiata TaxID=3824 RepID=A0AAN9M782_CANGL